MQLQIEWNSDQNVIGEEKGCKPRQTNQASPTQLGQAHRCGP